MDATVRPQPRPSWRLFLIALTLAASPYLLRTAAATPGRFMEELVLLSGAWLLASTCFSSPLTAFFVSTAIAGSALWTGPDGLNLRPWSTLPLLLYLLRRFLDSGSRVPLLAAGLLVVLQGALLPPAFALQAPASAALALAGAWAFGGEALRERLRARARPLGSLAAVASIGAVLASAALARVGPGAPPPILAAAGMSDFWQYLDLVSGLAPHGAASLYCGCFTLALAPPALIEAGAARVLRGTLGALAGLLVLAALPALLAKLGLTPGPGPLATSAPLVRLALIFLAGRGLQALLERRDAAARSGLLVAVCVLLAALSTAAPLRAAVLPKSVAPPMAAHLAQGDLVAMLAGAGALAAGLAAGALLLWGAGPRRRPLALALILLLHPLDVFGWKCRMTWVRSQFPGTAPVARDGTPR